MPEPAERTTPKRIAAALSFANLNALGGRVTLPSLILCFVIFACLVPAIVDANRVWEDRATVIRDSSRDTSNLARSISQHAEDAFRGVDGFLGAVVQWVENDGQRPETLARLRNVLIARHTTLR